MSYSPVSYAQPTQYSTEYVTTEQPQQQYITTGAPEQQYITTGASQQQYITTQQPVITTGHSQAANAGYTQAANTSYSQVANTGYSQAANTSYSQVANGGQQQWPVEATSSHVRTMSLGAGENRAVAPQQTRTIAAGGSSMRVEHNNAPVQFLQSQGAVRDIPLNQSTTVERLDVNPESYVNHMGSRGTQHMKMDKQEIMMSEHEIVMPQETVVHPQAVHIEEEEVVLQPETHLSPREVIVQPYTSVQPQEVIVKPQVIVAKPKTVIRPEEVILTPHTVIQPKGITLRPQDIIVADEEIVVETGKTTVHDLGCDVYKQDQDVEVHGARGFNVSYNHNIDGNVGNTKEVHNMGVNTVRNLKFEGYQSFVQNEQSPRTIEYNNHQQNQVITAAAPQQYATQHVTTSAPQQVQYVSPTRSTGQQYATQYVTASAPQQYATQHVTTRAPQQYATEQMTTSVGAPQYVYSNGQPLTQTRA